MHSINKKCNMSPRIFKRQTCNGDKPTTGLTVSQRLAHHHAFTQILHRPSSVLHAAPVMETRNNTVRRYVKSLHCVSWLRLSPLKPGSCFWFWFSAAVQHAPSQRGSRSNFGSGHCFSHSNTEALQATSESMRNQNKHIRAAEYVERNPVTKVCFPLCPERRKMECSTRSHCLEDLLPQTAQGHNLMHFF